MAETSTPSGLSERLRKRREEEEKRIEAEGRRYEDLITSELKQLGASARSGAARELRSIENDLEAGTAWTGALLRKAWVRTLATAISLLLGILIGSWGLTQWLSSRVRALMEVETRIEQQEVTLQRLEGKTWGLDLHETGNGEYVVLPQGAWMLDHNNRPHGSSLDRGGAAGHQAGAAARGAHDRAGEALERGIAVAVGAVRAGAAEFRRARRWLARAADELAAPARAAAAARRRAGDRLRGARSRLQADRRRVGQALEAAAGLPGMGAATAEPG